MKHAIILIFTVLLFLGCKNEKKDSTNTENEASTEQAEQIDETPMNNLKTVTINLESKSDTQAGGVVTFTEEDGVVRMTANLINLTPGEHAIHLHEKADCTAADGTSAGGHWNPTAQPHGKWDDEKGFHLGDIGNFTVDENGQGEVNFSTDKWCIGCDDVNKNILGKSVIVHQGVDDFVSQPTGDAGGRVSCGGIIQ